MDPIIKRCYHFLWPKQTPANQASSQTNRLFHGQTEFDDLIVSILTCKAQQVGPLTRHGVDAGALGEQKNKSDCPFAATRYNAI